MTEPRPGGSHSDGTGAGAGGASRPRWWTGRFAGLVSIAVGCVFAALATVQTEEDEIAWMLYAPSLALAAAGVIIIRLASRRAARHAGSLERDARTLEDSLARIAGQVTALEAAKNTLPTGEVHLRIDALLREDLDRFVEARHALTQLHGLSAYADIMNEFAAGERYLNRVWSASADGYVDEVGEYLIRARCQFEAARERLSVLQAGRSRNG